MVDEPSPQSCDPALAALFVPSKPRAAGAYDACTTSAPIETAIPAGFHASGVEHLEALEAFGTAGSYDRARMVQLYAGRRADVLRAWRVAGGRLESLTAISPYPDAQLTRLNPGTLLIRWTVVASR